MGIVLKIVYCVGRVIRRQCLLLYLFTTGSYRRLQERIENPPKKLRARRITQKPMRRVLISFPRSGTHWLKQMIADAMNVPEFAERFDEPEKLKDLLDENPKVRLIYEHFRFDLHGEILDPAIYPDLRIVLLHRHPLDQFISQTWKRLLIDGRDSPDPKADPSEVAKGMLLGRYDDYFGFPYDDAYRRTHKRHVLDWLESGHCLSVKYEDLVEQPREQLLRCLEHMEIKYHPRDIPKIVKYNQFKVLSGGRKPGVIDETDHYRRGVPGEWKSLFSPEEIASLREKYGNIFSRQGYEI